MDAVKFLQEQNRMMLTDPEAYRKAKEQTLVIGYVAEVEKWSKAHPCKTRLQDFFREVSRSCA